MNDVRPVPSSEIVGRRLAQDRLVAIVRTGSIDSARACAAAARDGGVSCIEITFGVPGCLDLVAEIAATWPGVLIGVGTVLQPEQVRAAASAGACFAVSPHVDVAVVRATRDAGLVSIPGAATPTEIVSAHRAGASMVKVFPIKTLGGAAYVKLVRGPLPDIPLLVTGGVELGSVREMLAAGATAVGATTDLFDPVLVTAGRMQEIQTRARAFRAAAAEAMLPP